MASKPHRAAPPAAEPAYRATRSGVWVSEQIPTLPKGGIVVASEIPNLEHLLEVGLLEPIEGSE